MAKRSIVKTAERVRGVDEGGYTLTSSEILELLEVAQKEGISDAIYTAFYGGFVLGHRATIAGKYHETTV